MIYTVNVLAPNDWQQQYQYQVNYLGDNTISFILHDGTRYLAFHKGGSVGISDDLINWTIYENSVTGLNPLDKPIDVIYNNGTYLAIYYASYDYAVSNDGIHWTIRQYNVGHDSNYVTKALYHNGYYYVLDSEGYLYRTSDLSTWTKTRPFTTYDGVTVGESYWGMLNVGNNIIVFGSADNYRYTSTDGTNWTEYRGSFSWRTRGAGKWFYYINGEYIVVTGSGYIFKSTDLSTWSDLDAIPIINYSYGIDSLNYTNNQYIFTGRTNIDNTIQERIMSATVPVDICQNKKFKKIYTFLNGNKYEIPTIYTFIDGQKKYLIKTPLVTVNPYYSEATVYFSSYSPGSVINGNSIRVPYNGYVSGSIVAANHDTVYFDYTDIKEDINYRPHLPRTVISPSIYYMAGISYQVTSWASRGQNIASGTYTYHRGNYVNTWIVTTNENGEVTGFSASGKVKSTTSGGPISITPAGGWRSLGLVD